MKSTRPSVSSKRNCANWRTRYVAFSRHVQRWSRTSPSKRKPFRSTRRSAWVYARRCRWTPRLDQYLYFHQCSARRPHCQPLHRGVSACFSIQCTTVCLSLCSISLTPVFSLFFVIHILGRFKAVCIQRVHTLPAELILSLQYVLGTCESFFLRSTLQSNRPSDSISNRIFESNRPYIPANI